MADEWDGPTAWKTDDGVLHLAWPTDRPSTWPCSRELMVQMVERINDEMANAKRLEEALRLAATALERSYHAHADDTKWRMEFVVPAIKEALLAHQTLRARGA